MTARNLFLMVSVSILFLCEGAAAKCTHRILRCEDVPYVSTADFSLETLTLKFNELLHESADYTEAFLVWTTDRKVADPEMGDKLPIPSLKPLMYQFKIGDNIFFLWRSDSGSVTWTVINGKNVLEPDHLGAKICFAGQSFARHGDEPKYRPSTRNLRLLVGDLSTLPPSRVLGILAYFDELLPCPHDLHLGLKGSFGSVKKYFRGAIQAPLLISEECKSLSEQSPDSRVAYIRRGGQRIVRVWKSKEIIFEEDYSSLDELQQRQRALVGK